ncbi:3437_t:CDS:1, partial [Entrophospora sp. SA101]
MRQNRDMMISNLLQINFGMEQFSLSCEACPLGGHFKEPRKTIHSQVVLA